MDFTKWGCHILPRVEIWLLRLLMLSSKFFGSLTFDYLLDWG